MKYKYLIKKIINNYQGYPFNRKIYWNILEIEDKELDFIVENIKFDNFKLSNFQKKELVKINSILFKEIDDWEWETIMDYPKEDYRKEIIEKFQKEIDI